ncbi:MAG TPA: hypothetical protein VLU43_00485 [Anaeromyxobacteraceae bacterium]|nr:hypothetical protein [Anaeromyxobacteraceae bacterium]
MDRALRATAVCAAAVVAACAGRHQKPCPGEPVGTFLFTATDLGAPRPYCAKEPPEGTDVVGTFSGTLVQDAGLGTASLCIESDKASDYHGRVDAGVFTLTAPSGVAVLAVCGSNCAASSALDIAGSVQGDGTFSGTLVESFAYSSGDCGSCALPCEATYGLVGTPR